MRQLAALLLLAVTAITVWAEDFGKPLDQYVVSSEFGYRKNPMGGIEGNMRLHKGVDLVGPYNSPVKAVKSGVIVEHWPPPNGFFKGHPVYGGLVVIEHSDGIFTLYAHLKDTFIKEGHKVKKGQIIGIQGSTGLATGDHLHFEVITNPLNYLDNK